MLASTLPLLAVFGAGLYKQLVLGQPFGNPSMSDGVLLVVLGSSMTLMTGICMLLWFARLDVTVGPDEIVIRFRPFHVRGRRIAIREIVEANARNYEPLREYGGWGLRVGRNGRAYNVSGAEGVQLTLRDGSRILIGSQRSGQLESAIRTAMSSTLP